VPGSCGHSNHFTSRLVGRKLAVKPGQGVTSRFNFKEMDALPDNGQISATRLLSDGEFSRDSSGPIDTPRFAEKLDKRRFC
jgi:hypothetical protein